MKKTAQIIAVGLVMLMSIGATGVAVGMTPNSELNREKTSNLGKVVRLYGYNCPVAEVAFYKGQDQVGHQFKLVCTTGSFNLTIRPNHTWKVAPARW